MSDGTIFEKKGLHPEQPITLHIDAGTTSNLTLSIIMHLHHIAVLHAFSCADEVVPGLDETFASMKKGEVCIVQIPPEYGFGDEQKQCDLALVPANSTLSYEIEMISFVKVLYQLL